MINHRHLFHSKNIYLLLFLTSRYISALFPFPTSPQYFSLICDPFADPIISLHSRDISNNYLYFKSLHYIWEEMIIMALLHMAGLENSECIWKIQLKPEVAVSVSMTAATFKYTYRAPLRRIGQEYSANVASSTFQSLKRIQPLPVCTGLQIFTLKQGRGGGTYFWNETSACDYIHVFNSSQNH
jgi:hypothetical protein